MREKSGQGIYCLITEYSIKILLKMKNTTQQPLKRNGQVQVRGVGNYIWLKWVFDSNK